jgi:Leucine-rich repeat (LRR) protein
VCVQLLDLSCCELEHLPEQFTYQTRLLELNLGSNKLEDLPESMGRMTRLVVLNLSDNNLKDLPLSMGYCIGLGKIGAGINIDRNPIKSSDMLKKWKIGTDHLCDYLEKRMVSKYLSVIDIQYSTVTCADTNTSSQRQSSAEGLSPAQRAGWQTHFPAEARS